MGPDALKRTINNFGRRVLYRKELTLDASGQKYIALVNEKSAKFSVKFGTPKWNYAALHEIVHLVEWFAFGDEFKDVLEHARAEAISRVLAREFGMYDQLEDALSENTARTAYKEVGMCPEDDPLYEEILDATRSAIKHFHLFKFIYGKKSFSHDLTHGSNHVIIHAT